jgi:hypothetical protein
MLHALHHYPISLLLGHLPRLRHEAKNLRSIPVALSHLRCIPVARFVRGHLNHDCPPCKSGHETSIKKRPSWLAAACALPTGTARSAPLQRSHVPQLQRSGSL